MQLQLTMADKHVKSTDMMTGRAFAALIALGLMGAVSPARAADCKPLWTAAGPPTQPSQLDAERTAINTWRAQVNHKYGRAYADWDKAGSKKISCEERAEYFFCWAEAEPCR
ncbi:MAG: hypothetical protein H6878_05370 [Rhodobiaceae bacterium]|nr:hypothetical protein [Rhodobiaceae bacterium]MCC0015721.1 hypothetical protein [Rhodobiaceae bacterium]MCC0053980.1 hypothetical protein [Rhodobiaceae bacterium]